MPFNFDDSKGATVSHRLSEYEACKSERQDYLDVAREVTEWLIPARGVYDTNSKPTSRILVPKKVVNPKAKQAFSVMTSFLKDGICPASRPWFSRGFKKKAFNDIPSLKTWSYEATEAMGFLLREANFYPLVSSYIKEICAFGTGAMGVFPGMDKTLNFQPLTMGEYAIATNAEGRVDRLYRTIYMNFHQMYQRFGMGLPAELLEKFHNRDTTLDMWYTVVEGVVPEKFMDMPYTRFFCLVASTGNKYDGGIFYKMPKENKYPEFIHVEGASEFPYPTTRFDVLTDEDWGIGPGFEALPVIKRLQEVVKSNSIAYHKSIRPPLNIPVSMKNNVKTHPDGLNYYINPDEIIRPAYDVRFDHQSAEVAEGKLEATLKDIFFNDVFLTASRDPNASPLKARQVEEISSDKYARLGDTVERIFSEGIEPILNRAFMIASRAGDIPPLPEEYKNMDIGSEFTLTSILAQAIKARAAVPMMEFLQTVGAVAQFDQNALDIPNTDEFLYEMGEIKNIHPKLMNSREQIASKRQARQEALAEKAQANEQAQAAAQGGQAELTSAQAMNQRSQAGVNFAENVNEGGGLL